MLDKAKMFDVLFNKLMRTEKKPKYLATKV